MEYLFQQSSWTPFFTQMTSSLHIIQYRKQEWAPKGDSDVNKSKALLSIQSYFYLIKRTTVNVQIGSVSYKHLNKSFLSENQKSVYRKEDLTSVLLYY